MKIKSAACWSGDMEQHKRCRFLACLCPCHSKAYKERKAREAAEKAAAKQKE